MNVKEIISKQLTLDGYDGLYNTDCGCSIGDLMPCKSYSGECKAGYKRKVKDEWIISPEQESKGEKL